MRNSLNYCFLESLLCPLVAPAVGEDFDWALIVELTSHLDSSLRYCAVRLTSVASLASGRRYWRRLSLKFISSSSFFGSGGVFLRGVRDGPELDGLADLDPGSGRRMILRIKWS